MPIVSTGQITIVDNNDARPITAYLTSSHGLQQIYSKDNSTATYTPDWLTANSNQGLMITAKVYVGGTTGAIDITSQLSSRKFSFSAGGAAITAASNDNKFVNNTGGIITTATIFTVTHDGTGSKLYIKGNLSTSVGACTVFFEGDYQDPATGLISHVIAQVTLSSLKTGTNAVYVLFRGKESISPSNSTTKSVIAINAQLVRSSGVDPDNLEYRWYDALANKQVDTSFSGYATRFGLKTTATTVFPTAVATDLNVNVPSTGAVSPHNTLVISQDAVTDVGVFRVDIRDTLEDQTYTGYITVYDVDDPYSVMVISTAGDKFQNGVGTTDVYPLVYNGGTKVTPLSGWSFTWSLQAKDSKPAAFIDTARNPSAGGTLIESNTAFTSGTPTAPTGTAAEITLNVDPVGFGTVTAGDPIKVQSPDGAITKFYEVASKVGANGATSTKFVLRATPTTKFLYTDYPAPATNELAGWTLWVCKNAGGTITTSGGSTDLAAKFTLTGYDIDGKGTITCQANRP